MTEQYYHMITDMWRIFRGAIEDPDRFSEAWWQKWIKLTNRFGERYPEKLSKNLICAFTWELERIRENEQRTT